MTCRWRIDIEISLDQEVEMNVYQNWVFGVFVHNEPVLFGPVSLPTRNTVTKMNSSGQYAFSYNKNNVQSISPRNPVSE